MSTADLTQMEHALERLLSAGTSLPGRLPLKDHQELWSAFRRASVGGKRFRPALLLSTHRALGGLRPAAAVQVAAAIELLHTAFVVQDDVIDEDQLRRGAPSLPGEFAARAREQGATAAGARRYGEAAGILAGDLGMLGAVRAIARCDAPAPVVDALLDLVETTIHGSVAGELADVRLQLDLDPPAPMREVLAVAELKTALYSFQLPLHAAALLADAEEPVLRALDEIGVLFGIGFQLFDDLLGVFGDERRTGKSALGDLREGKRTAMLAHAATSEAWPQLHPLIGRPDLDETGATDARALLTRCGSRAWTEELARWHLEGANTAAARHGLPSALRQEIRAASDEVLRTAQHALLPSPAVQPRTEQPA